MELDASSIESSEDWENSVNSSELDVQYQSDDERIDNEVSTTNITNIMITVMPTL